MSIDKDCEHKYRTNLDGLVTKEAPSIYATVIFCEKCGLIKYVANASENDKAYYRAQSKENE